MKAATGGASRAIAEFAVGPMEVPASLAASSTDLLSRCEAVERGPVWPAEPEHFDGYTVPAGDVSQDVSAGVPGMTGMPGLAGPQIGTREICNWICAAAMVDGRPHYVVDYIPIYTSPVGTAYAYCVDV